MNATTLVITLAAAATALAGTPAHKKAPPPATSGDSASAELRPLAPLAPDTARVIEAQPASEAMPPLLEGQRSDAHPDAARAGAFFVSVALGAHTFLPSGTLDDIGARPGLRQPRLGQGAPVQLSPSLTLEYRRAFGRHNVGVALDLANYTGYSAYEDGALFSLQATPLTASVRYFYEFPFGLRLSAAAGGGGYFVTRSFAAPSGGVTSQKDIPLGIHAALGFGWKLNDALGLVVEDRYSLAPGMAASLLTPGGVVSTDEGGNTATLGLTLSL